MTATTINRLIDAGGDTTAVSCAIDSIATMLQLMDTGKGASFDSAGLYGLVVILETAAAALRYMEEEKP